MAALYPESTRYPPEQSLDRTVPRAVLSRRDAVSFCSSSCYLTVPRFEVGDFVTWVQFGVFLAFVLTG